MFFFSSRRRHTRLQGDWSSDVCSSDLAEYNRWAYSTPPEKQFAVKDLAEKAKGYGIPAITVDGNDVLAVYEVTKLAVERARRGHGVQFVEVKTYRRKGHAEHDDQHYVPKD